MFNSCTTKNYTVNKVSDFLQRFCLSLRDQIKKKEVNENYTACLFLFLNSGVNIIFKYVPVVRVMTTGQQGNRVKVLINREVKYRVRRKRISGSPSLCILSVFNLTL